MKANLPCVFRAVLYASCLAAGSSPLSAGAAVVTNVSIINFAFSPQTVTVNVNDEVQWTWDGNRHSSTSTTGLWDSGVFNPPHTFVYQFTSPGTFNYLCTVHLFTGSVTVQAVNAPPTVSITSPSNNVVLSAPASFSLAASASDSDGSISNVQFFEGTVSLGTLTSSPYSVAVNNLGAGDYTFSAVATGGDGETATNSVTVHAVTPLPITLSAQQRVSGSSFQFSYSANVGLQYVVQRSPDLADWTGLLTNMATNNPMSFLDSSASTGLNFYRVGRLPNP